MRALIPTTRLRVMAAGIAAAVVATTPVPSIAQDNSEARIRKLESEIRALQRRVFPGDDGRFFEPQISPSSSATGATSTNSTSTTAVTDILARLDAMEVQLQRLTALSEENSNAFEQIETRLTALESSGSTVGPAIGVGTGAATGAATAVTETASNTTTQETTPTPAAQTGPSAERLAAVQAITKPITDDPADDEYSYGFRLWNAGYYPEARQQLNSFVERYGSHWRATYARNLLGRAYLDDNMPEEAARWFLNNYQADKQAARAPDSLLYLSEAMIALNDTNRACIALAEFGEIYPALAAGRLSGMYERNRQRITCN